MSYFNPQSNENLPETAHGAPHHQTVLSGASSISDITSDEVPIGEFGLLDSCLSPEFVSVHSNEFTPAFSSKLYVGPSPVYTLPRIEDNANISTATMIEPPPRNWSYDNLSGHTVDAVFQSHELKVDTNYQLSPTHTDRGTSASTPSDYATPISTPLSHQYEKYGGESMFHGNSHFYSPTATTRSTTPLNADASAFNFTPIAIGHSPMTTGHNSASTSRSNSPYVVSSSFRDDSTPSMYCHDIYDKSSSNYHSSSSSSSNNLSHVGRVQQSPVPIGNGRAMRQLPCRTYLSIGTCPYGDRCVFLHDARLRFKGGEVTDNFRSTNNMRGGRLGKGRDTEHDALFWPTLSLSDVSKNLDSKGQPLIYQAYNVKDISSVENRRDQSVAVAPSSCSNERSILSVFSTWEYFVDYLTFDVIEVENKTHDLDARSYELSQGKRRRNETREVAEFPLNIHTNTPRLPILVSLANGS